MKSLKQRAGGRRGKPRGYRRGRHRPGATGSPPVRARRRRNADPALERLVARPDLDGVTLYHLHTSGPAPFAAPEVADRFRSVSFFVGPALRKPVAEGRADFMPIFLSQIPGLFSSGRIPLDVALVQLSPPDRHGLCTLGTLVTPRALPSTTRGW